MILKSRMWRMVIRVATLIVTTILVLVLAAPVSYALQDDQPKPLTSTDYIITKDNPFTESYVYTSTLPDLSRMITTQSGSKTYYWFPLPRYEGRIFVRTEGFEFLRAYYRAADLNLDSSRRPGNFYGKLALLSAQGGSEEAIDAFALRGITVDKETTLVLLQGEQPSTYRPVVPVVGVLVIFWVGALVGLYNILTRRRPARAKRVPGTFGR